MRMRDFAPVLALFVCGPVAAQSLFNSAGMGLPVEALDGRARALGSLGIGLQGGALMPTDPAAAGRLSLPTGIISGQPSWVAFSRSATGDSGTFQGARFPLLAVAYPTLGGMMTVQLGSFLDQHFRGERAATVNLTDGPVDVTDLFEQDGAVSTLNIGFARMLGEATSVGVTFGRYAGSVRRELSRDFGETVSAGAVEAYESEGSWSYSGHLITGGVATDLGESVRLAASATWSTALDAKATDDTQGADRAFDLPLQLRLGASAILSPGLVVSASAARADWSGTGDDLAGTVGASSSTGVGLGVELSRARLLGRAAPLRFGFRRASLPFSVTTGAATERIFSTGLAMNLSPTAGPVLASVDFALERGRRKSASVTESFWRATVSLRVSGF